MNDNGNKYALAALKDRRARIAGEIFALKKQIAQKLRQMAHQNRGEPSRGTLKVCN